MGVIYDASGLSWSGLGITQNVKTIELPEGWAKEVKDTSTLANTTVKTKKLGDLKDFEDVVLTVEYDPAVNITTTNGQCVATLPDSNGTITFWGQVSGVGKPDGFEVDGLPEQEITITVTNLNGSNVETVPAYAA